MANGDTHAKFYAPPQFCGNILIKFAIKHKLIAP